MDTSEEHRVACGSWLELAVSPLCVVREKYNQFIYVKPLVPNVSALLSNVSLSVVLQMITPFSFHVIHLEYDYAYFTSFTLRLIYCNINRLTKKRCMFFPSNCQLLTSIDLFD